MKSLQFAIEEERASFRVQLAAASAAAALKHDQLVSGYEDIIAHAEKELARRSMEIKSIITDYEAQLATVRKDYDCLAAAVGNNTAVS